MHSHKNLRRMAKHRRDIRVWFDLETVRFPESKNCTKVLNELETFFNSLGKVQKVQFFANLSTIDPLIIKSCYIKGFQFHNIFNEKENFNNNIDVAGLRAAKLISENILFWILDSNKVDVIPCIIIVSSSPFLADLVSNLANRSYEVMLYSTDHTIPTSSSSSNYYSEVDIATSYFSWDKLTVDCDSKSSLNNLCINYDDIDQFTLMNDLDAQTRSHTLSPMQLSNDFRDPQNEDIFTRSANWSPLWKPSATPFSSRHLSVSAPDLCQLDIKINSSLIRKALSERNIDNYFDNDDDNLLRSLNHFSSDEYSSCNNTNIRKPSGIQFFDSRRINSVPNISTFSNPQLSGLRFEQSQNGNRNSATSSTTTESEDRSHTSGNGLQNEWSPVVDGNFSRNCHCTSNLQVPVDQDESWRVQLARLSDPMERHAWLAAERLLYFIRSHQQQPYPGSPSSTTIPDCRIYPDTHVAEFYNVYPEGREILLNQGGIRSFCGNFPKLFIYFVEYETNRHGIKLNHHNTSMEKAWMDHQLQIDRLAASEMQQKYDRVVHLFYQCVDSMNVDSTSRFFPLSALMQDFHNRYPWAREIMSIVGGAKQLCMQNGNLFRIAISNVDSSVHVKAEQFRVGAPMEPSPASSGPVMGSLGRIQVVSNRPVALAASFSSGSLFSENTVSTLRRNNSSGYVCGEFTMPNVETSTVGVAPPSGDFLRAASTTNVPLTSFATAPTDIGQQLAKELYVFIVQNSMGQGKKIWDCELGYFFKKAPLAREHFKKSGGVKMFCAQHVDLVRVVEIAGKTAFIIRAVNVLYNSARLGLL